jgi:hypothetical protein
MTNPFERDGVCRFDSADHHDDMKPRWQRSDVHRAVWEPDREQFRPDFF